MQKIARFERVSQEQFENDFAQKIGKTAPAAESIALPKRATQGSAGYDFFAPCDFTLSPGESITVPTGFRCSMENGWVLQIFPRSSLGFKFRLQLDNTVGIIDSDYYFAKNEGHIMIKITNDSKENKTVDIKAGEAFAQCVFIPFGITVDDDATAVRTGGFGSTNK